MDMIGGRVDVRYHGVDGGIRIRHQGAFVSADRLEAADRLRETKDVLVAFRHATVNALRNPKAGVIGLGQPRQSRLQPGNTAPSDVGLAQQQVGEHAQERQGPHDHDPGDA